MNRTFPFLFYAGACLLLFASCSKDSGDGTDAAGRLRVVTTTSMITDMVRIVGGGHIQVTGLMGPGVDPHLYRAKARDVTRLSTAGVIFYNGLHLEGKMGDVLEKLQQGGTMTVAVAEAIDRSKLLKPAEFEGAYDPHVWFDVTLWMEAVKLVETTLIDRDPDHKDAYHANARAYVKELGSLDQEVKAMAQGVPEDQRVLITAHDAFNYFGRAYGFEVRGLQGISTASEAGAADVRDLADFIVKRRIPAIFVESSVPVANIEAVVAACRSQGHTVKVGGELYSDALGTAGTPQGTYVGMVRHNITTIVTSLKQ